MTMNYNTSREDRVTHLKSTIQDIIQKMKLDFSTRDYIDLIHDNEFKPEDEKKVFELIKLFTTDGRYLHNKTSSFGKDTEFTFGRGYDATAHNKYCFSKVTDNLYLNWMECVTEFIVKDYRYYTQIRFMKDFTIKEYDKYSNIVSFVVDKHDICINK